MNRWLIVIAFVAAGCPTRDVYIDGGTRIIIFDGTDAGPDAGAFCDICTCDDGTCPVDANGTCEDETNCTADAGPKPDAGRDAGPGAGQDAGLDAGADAGCIFASQCEGNPEGLQCLEGTCGCFTNSDCPMSGATCVASHCAGGSDAGFCDVCLCDNGTCPINSSGECADGYNCVSGDFCGVCTCNDSSCPYDNAGDCHDGYNCLRGGYCHTCTCDNGNCPINSDGTCSDDTNCLHPDAGHPEDAGSPIDAGPPADAGPVETLEDMTVTGQLTFDPCEMQWRGYYVGGCGNGTPATWTPPGPCENGQAVDGTSYDPSSTSFPAEPPCLAGAQVTIIDQIDQYEGFPSLGTGTTDSLGGFSVAGNNLSSTQLGLLGSATDPSGLVEQSASLLALPAFTTTSTKGLPLYVVSVAFMQHIADVIGMSYSSMISQGVALVHVVPTGSESSASAQELFSMYGRTVGMLTPGFDQNVSLSKMPFSETMTSAPYTYYLSSDLNFVLSNIGDDVTTSSSGLVVIVGPAPVVDQSNSQDESAYTVSASGEAAFSVFGDQPGGEIASFIADGTGREVDAGPGPGLQDVNASGTVQFDPAELSWRGLSSWTPPRPCSNGQDADGGTWDASSGELPCLEGDALAVNNQYGLTQGSAPLGTTTVSWEGSYTAPDVDLIETMFGVLGSVTDPSGLASPSISTMALPPFTSSSLASKPLYVVSTAFMEHIASTIGMSFTTMMSEGVALVHVVDSTGAPVSGKQLYELHGLPAGDFTPGFNSNAYLTALPLSTCPGSSPAAYYLGPGADGVMACSDGEVATSSSGLIVLVGPPALVASAGTGGGFTESAYTVSTSGEGSFVVLGGQANAVVDVFLPNQ